MLLVGGEAELGGLPPVGLKELFNSAQGEYLGYISRQISSNVTWSTWRQVVLRRAARSALRRAARSDQRGLRGSDLL